MKKTQFELKNNALSIIFCPSSPGPMESCREIAALIFLSERNSSNPPDSIKFISTIFIVFIELFGCKHRIDLNNDVSIMVPKFS